MNDNVDVVVARSKEIVRFDDLQALQNPRLEQPISCQ